MNIVAELHTHTSISHHAHHTIDEMFRQASILGLKAMAITNHAPALDDGANVMHFKTLFQLPRFINGVFFIKGAEANVIGLDGRIDLSQSTLSRLEFVIASMHDSCMPHGSVQDNTRAYLNLLENPGVHCIGHCGTPKFPFDHEAVVKKCAERGKIIEINSHSAVARKGSYENCLDIATLCAKHGVRLILTTDAHSIYNLGEVGGSIKLVEEIGFPEDMIINTDLGRLSAYFKEIADIDIPIN